MTRRKLKNVLTPYMVQDGMQPLDVLMGAVRYYLDKGDVQSAVKVAETAAQYRHPRFQAVAVQGQLFELDSSGNLAASYGKSSHAAPAIRISWNDEPEVLAPLQQHSSHGEAVPAPAQSECVKEESSDE